MPLVSCLLDPLWSFTRQQVWKPCVPLWRRESSSLQCQFYPVLNQLAFSKMKFSVSFVVLALSALAAAGPVTQPGTECGNNSNLSCCDDLVKGLAGLTFGVGCNMIIGANFCDKKTACCTSYNTNAVVSLECTQIA